MPLFEIIQLHDSVDETKLQFPLVPLSALVEDPDHRSIPFGVPVRAVVLTSMASSAATPAKVNQHYYNTDDHTLYTSIQSGSAIVWNTGESPQDGVLYKVENPGAASDTLYVKSIGESGAGLAKLVLSGGEAASFSYEGPFAVSYAAYTNNTCTCSIQAGKVFAPWTAYTVPVSSITVPPNEDVYLVGSFDRHQTFQYTTDPAVSGNMRTRIAHNEGGRMVQYQYGDVLLGGLVSAGSSSSETPTYIPIEAVPSGSIVEGNLTFQQISATDDQQHSGSIGYITV